MSSLWGIYSGYELCENEALPGREEYLDSEKYQLKERDWDAPGNIKDWITRLNEIRRQNRALHFYDNLRFYDAENEAILFYGKMTPARDDIILVVVNLDPFRKQLSLLCRIRDQRPRMRTEACEERQLLAANQDVDRVDLDQPHAIERATEVPPIDAALRPRVGEALRAECDAARSSERDLLRRHFCQSATVTVTELMTTSVCGRSLRSVSTRCIASSTSRPLTI